MIQRKFRSNGDVDAAQRLVFASRGIDRARELAAQHAGLAVQAVRSLVTLTWQIFSSHSLARGLRSASVRLRRRCATLASPGLVAVQAHALTSCELCAGGSHAAGGHCACAAVSGCAAGHHGARADSQEVGTKWVPCSQDGAARMVQPSLALGALRKQQHSLPARF
jgi:hypothetical protein